MLQSRFHSTLKPLNKFSPPYHLSTTPPANESTSLPPSIYNNHSIHLNNTFPSRSQILVLNSHQYLHNSLLTTPVLIFLTIRRYAIDGNQLTYILLLNPSPKFIDSPLTSVKAKIIQHPECLAKTYSSCQFPFENFHSLSSCCYRFESLVFCSFLKITESSFQDAKTLKKNYSS